MLPPALACSMCFGDQLLTPAGAAAHCSLLSSSSGHLVCWTVTVLSTWNSPSPKYQVFDSVGQGPHVRFLPAFLMILMQRGQKPHFEKPCLQRAHLATKKSIKYICIFFSQLWGLICTKGNAFISGVPVDKYRHLHNHCQSRYRTAPILSHVPLLSTTLPPGP